MENQCEPWWPPTPAGHCGEPSSCGDVFTSSGNELASNNRAVESTVWAAIQCDAKNFGTTQCERRDRETEPLFQIL